MAGYAVTFSVVDQATAQIDKINRHIRQMREPIERQARAIRQFADVSGLDKVAEGFRSITRHAGEAFSAMSRLVPVMGALTGAASLAGLAALVNSFADFSHDLELTATRAAITADQLQIYENAAALAGASTRDLDESLIGLAEARRNAQLGIGQAFEVFKKANIDLKDTTGHLKTTAQLLPEVMNFLKGIKDPAQRMAYASLFGSQAVARLTEDLDRSGKSWDELTAKGATYGRMSAAQIEAARRFREALAELSIPLTDLKNQIGAVLAEALTPLIKEFGEWVRVHQPQIVAGIRRIITGFREWFNQGGWEKIKAGADLVLESLKWIYNHLELIKDAAIAIATVFTVRWAIGIVGAIAMVGRALSVGLIAMGPGGLILAGLGAIAAVSLLIYQHWDDIKALWNELKNFFGGLGAPEGPIPDIPRTAGPPHPGASPGGPGGLGPALPGRIGAPGVPYQSGSLAPELKITSAQYDAFRNAVAGIESGGRYDIMGGAGGHFAGRYQLGALAGHTELAETAQRLGVATPDPSEFLHNPAEQERFFEAYTAGHHDYLMKNSAKYRALSPEGKLEALGYAHNQGAGGAAKWLESGGKGGQDAFGTWATKYPAAIARALGQVQGTLAQGEPGQAAQFEGPPGELAQGRGMEGSVDITVTHKNPPPGVQVAATGTGDVNLEAPRVEHAEMGV